MTLGASQKFSVRTQVAELSACMHLLAREKLQKRFFVRGEGRPCAGPALGLKAGAGVVGTTESADGCRS